MKAVQLVAHGAPGKFNYGEVAEPVPAADEVTVRVRACGLNYLDLWLEEGQLPIPLALPRIPGGEVSGEIAGVGRDVSGWSKGQRVAVQSNIFCGQCEFCARGRESLCLKGQLLGVERDGGFAEMVAVPARALVGLPENVDFLTSAALTLAGSTAMHMLTVRASAGPGDWVLAVGGAGGVGSAAIQIASGLGARVIATGSSDARRQFALSLGAEHAVDSSRPDWPARVRELTGKRGVDLVVEHVGGEVLQQCFTCLARGGTIVTCGATAGREVPLKLWPIFVKEQKLVGSYGRNQKDLVATLDWAAQGKLKATIWRVYPLSQTADAFAALRQRQVLGKVVVDTTLV
ncbi:MAG TPA: zinc-binding dehydrogenase [Candidatus Baltobacteraceae bacterium]|jgi:NADPH:quinone reductase-like Zn-dependent oxidoreductase|nr:zinc-binding dehydrogenase [Candidatus Baltobacteraceae bacterium]